MDYQLYDSLGQAKSWIAREKRGLHCRIRDPVHETSLYEN